MLLFILFCFVPPYKSHQSLQLTIPSRVLVYMHSLNDEFPIDTHHTWHYKTYKTLLIFVGVIMGRNRKGGMSKLGLGIRLYVSGHIQVIKAAVSNVSSRSEKCNWDHAFLWTFIASVSESVLLFSAYCLLFLPLYWHPMCWVVPH